MKNRTALTFVLFSLLLGGMVSAIPATADNNSANVLKTVLNNSKESLESKIQDLKAEGITIPTDAASFNEQGLAEYNESLRALEGGDIGTAKTHALGAMGLFKSAIEVLNQEEISNSYAPADEINAVFESIVGSEIYADELRNLSLANEINVDFSDYYSTISSSKDFLAAGNLDEARDQLEIANEILDEIHAQIQSDADSRKDQRTKEFVSNTISQINKMIANAEELGLSQTIIDELHAVAEKLQNAKSTEEIIDATDDTGDLEEVSNSYDNARLQNLDEEYTNIVNHLGSLQSDAERLGIQLEGVDRINELLADIKQRISEGEMEVALQELEEIDYLIANLEELINDTIRQNQESLDTILQQISSLEEDANDIQGRATAENNADALAEINTALALTSEGRELALNGDLSGAEQKLTDATAHVDRAVEILQNAESQEVQ